jgi:hypothetical protein
MATFGASSNLVVPLLPGSTSGDSPQHILLAEMRGTMSFYLVSKLVRILFCRVLSCFVHLDERTIHVFYR